jgi:hypothetical protein
MSVGEPYREVGEGGSACAPRTRMYAAIPLVASRASSSWNCVVCPAEPLQCML